MRTRSSNQTPATAAAITALIAALAVLVLALSPNTATAKSRTVAIGGTIGKVTADPIKANSDSHSKTNRFTLQGDRKLYKLRIRSGATRVLKGKRSYRWSKASRLINAKTRVVVRGTLRGGTLTVRTVRIVKSRRARGSVAGVFKTAVILYNFSNDTSQPYTVAGARSEVFTGGLSSNAYWQEVSGGSISFTGKLPGSTDGDVFDWVTIPNTNADCMSNFTAWGNAANTAAGVNPVDYDKIIYVSPFPTGCPHGGVATGSKTSWFFTAGASTTMARVVAHELGHNFSLLHAGVTGCPIAPGNAMRVSLLVSGCFDQEDTYGGWGTKDPISLMGYPAVDMHHINAYQKTSLGIQPQANNLTLSAPGTYTLSPSAPTLPSGTQLTEVARPYTSPMYPDSLYAEYRQPYGVFDQFPSDSKWVNGINFYVAESGADETNGFGWNALMVDGVPFTDPINPDNVEPLPVGHSLYDPGSGHVYTTISAGGPTAQLDFRDVPLAGNRPTVSVIGSKIVYQAGTNQHNSVHVTEEGSDMLITDNATPIVAGAGCTAVGEQSAQCPLAGITGTDVNLGDMDDSFDDYMPSRIFGITVDPGTGKDVLDSETYPNIVTYASRTAPVNVSLDGVANDGESGESDNIAGAFSGIVGGSGDDVLTGDANDNSIDPGFGTDTVDGGSAGNDTASYATRASGVTINLNGAANSGTPGTENDTLTNMDSATGGSGGDTISSKPTYADGSAELLGGGGDDLITVTGPYGTTIRGGDGNDTLTGKTAIDRLHGDAGNDTLDGGSGAPGDYLTGGTGTDTLNYSSRIVNLTFNMASSVSGTNENDTLLGDIENAIGGSGADTFTGTTADNAFTGNNGADTFTGNDGNDAFTGGDGVDTYNGGNGTDTVSFADAVGTVDATVGGSATDGSPGNNVESIPATVENLTGGPESDTLNGDANANTLTGGYGADTLNGNDGHDVLAGGPSDEDATYYGANALDGGNGNDTLKATGWEVMVAEAGEDTYQGIGGLGATVDYTARSGAVNASLDSTPNDGDIASNEKDNIQGNIYVEGGSGNDTMSGNGSVNSFRGNGGNDTLSGGAGSDNIDGNDGNDVIDGGTGSDYLQGSAGTDTYSHASRTTDYTATVNGANSDSEGVYGFENITGGSGNDTLTGDANANVLDGGSGNDTLAGLAGNDNLTGNSGTDTVIYSAATAGVTVNLATTTAQNTVGAGTDTITTVENTTGSGFNDVLTGNTGANELQGLAGNDTLASSSGTDTVSYSAATGNVTVNLATTSGQNTVSAGTDTITGTENVTGSAYNDTLTGNSSANVIQGLLGNDVMNGSTGTDTVSYTGSTAAVTVSLATTSAQNTVGAGTDTISSLENLIGGSGGDTLTGSTGNNTITGGLGIDTVSAGSGTDSILIRNGDNDNPTTCGSGTDTVTADLSPSDTIASGGACETVNRAAP